MRTSSDGFNERAAREPSIGRHLDRIAAYLLMWDQIRENLPVVASALGVDAPDIRNIGIEDLKRAMAEYKTPDAWEAEARLGLLNQLIPLHDKMTQLLAWIDVQKRRFPERTDIWERLLTIEITSESLRRKMQQVIDS